MALEQSRAIGFAAKGFTKLTGYIRVGLQFMQCLLHTRPHDLGFTQALFHLAFESAKIAFPVQSEVQRCVEHRRGVQFNGAGR